MVAVVGKKDPLPGLLSVVDGVPKPMDKASIPLPVDLDADEEVGGRQVCIKHL